MEITKIVSNIQRTLTQRAEDIVIVCLNRECDSMLENAYRLSADGNLQQLFCQTNSSGDFADEAEIRMSETGDSLVSFHETRPNSRDHRPNGIRVPDEDRYFPCVIFFNNGSEPLTVEGDWVSPGKYTLKQDCDINSPKVQKAMREYINSQEVQEEVEELRRQMKEGKDE